MGGERGRIGVVAGVGGAAGRGGQHAHEVGDEVDRIVAELGIGGGVDAVGQRRPVRAALAGV